MESSEKVLKKLEIIIRIFLNSYNYYKHAQIKNKIETL